MVAFMLEYTRPDRSVALTGVYRIRGLGKGHDSRLRLRSSRQYRERHRDDDGDARTGWFSSAKNETSP